MNMETWRQEDLEAAKLQEWRREDLKAIAKKISEHRQENPSMIKEAARANNLDCKERLKYLYQRQATFEKDTVTWAFLKKLIDLEKKKIERNNRIIMMRDDDQRKISPAMIERARQYDVAILVGYKKGRPICCIFHQEKTPSMHVTKYNKAHCYGCGKDEDAIAVHQHLFGSTFADAVRALQ